MISNGLVARDKPLVALFLTDLLEAEGFPLVLVFDGAAANRAREHDPARLTTLALRWRPATTGCAREWPCSTVRATGEPCWCGIARS